MAKQAREKDDPARQILPVPEDPELFSFLEEAFHLQPRTVEPGLPNALLDAYPERLRLSVLLPGQHLGPAIHIEEYKPMQAQAPSREALVILCNRLLVKARRDCTNAFGKPQKYVVNLFSHLKGAEPYARFVFRCTPGIREYSESDPLPNEEETTTAKDRLLEMSLQNQRWMMEQFSEAVGSIMSRQDAAIENLQRTVAENFREHRETIKLRETLLDRSAEREREKSWLAWKLARGEDAIQFFKSFAPGVAAYLTKGAAGVDIGIKQFVESLSDTQRAAFFGHFGEDGQLVSRGILTPDQVNLFDQIARGAVDSRAIAAFVSGLEASQLAAAGQVLDQNQIATLLSVADAASKSSVGLNGVS